MCKGNSMDSSTLLVLKGSFLLNSENELNDKMFIYDFVAKNKEPCFVIESIAKRWREHGYVVAF